MTEKVVAHFEVWYYCSEIWSLW